MKKKKIIAGVLSVVLLAGAMTVFTACGPPLTGSGTLLTHEMDFTGFTKLSVSNAFQVEITRADTFFVSITVDSNLREFLNVKKVGSMLYIGLKVGRTYLHTTQRAIITMPDLSALELSGASKGDVSGFSTTDSLKLELSGASLLMLEDIKAGDTNCRISGASTVKGDLEMADGDFEVSGASTIELEGTAADVTMDISGASTIDLEDFTVVNAAIRLSGASNGTINASGTLNANVSGASSLYYVGNPTLGDIDISGASRVRQK